MMASLQTQTQLLMYLKHKTRMCISLVFASVSLIDARTTLAC